MIYKGFGTAWYRHVDRKTYSPIKVWVYQEKPRQAKEAWMLFKDLSKILKIEGSLVKKALESVQDKDWSEIPARPHPGSTPVVQPEGQVNRAGFRSISRHSDVPFIELECLQRFIDEVIIPSVSAGHFIEYKRIWYPPEQEGKDT